MGTMRTVGLVVDEKPRKIPEKAQENTPKAPDPKPRSKRSTKK